VPGVASATRRARSRYALGSTPQSFADSIRLKSAATSVPALGPGAVVILAADDHAAQGALGGVVVQGDARILEEPRQPWPQAEPVGDRLAETALRQRPLLLGPGADRGHQRRRAVGAQVGPSLPSSVCSSSSPTPPRGTLLLYRVELPDKVEHLGARARVVRLGVDELAPHVRPAMGEREAGPRPG